VILIDLRTRSDYFPTQFGSLISQPKEGEFSFSSLNGHAMIQGVSHRDFTPDSWVKFQVCQCEVCCGNNVTGTNCFLGSAV